LQYVWNERIGAPTLVGGRHLGVGAFDITQPPTNTVVDLLSRHNFAGLDNPASQLVLVRERRGINLASYTFKQYVNGIGVYGSRLTFVFTSQGRFLSFAGRYVPSDRQSTQQHISSCSTLLNSLDDQGDLIVSCEPIYYLSDNRISGYGTLLIPAFKIRSERVGGGSSTAFLVDADLSYHRFASHDIADRRIQVKYLNAWTDYWVNESCVYPGGCDSQHLDRMKDEVHYYADYMYSHHNRKAWNGTNYPSWYDSYYVRIVEEGAYWAGEKVHVGENARISVITHEFSHGVLNSETEGQDGAVAEGLSDVFGMLVSMSYTGEPEHWLYHNYPGDPNQPCTPSVHLDPDPEIGARCHQWARDTVGDAPGYDVSNDLGTYEPKQPGILYNIYDPQPEKQNSHLNASIYAKVFHLMETEFLIDPQFGEIKDYYNAHIIDPNDRLTKTQTSALLYRLVTDHLSGVSFEAHNDFGPALLQAAWNSFVEGEISEWQHVRVLSAVYGVGHRQAPEEIEGHPGTELRQAAFKDAENDIWLFYVLEDGRIQYQRRVYGEGWTSPAIVDYEDARAGSGLEAYTLPDNRVRIIYKSFDGPAVYFMDVDENGNISPPELFEVLVGHPVLSEVAPSGVYNGDTEYVVVYTTEGGLIMWDVDDLTGHVNSWKTVWSGMSLTTYYDYESDRNRVYLIYNGDYSGSGNDGKNIVLAWDETQAEWESTSSGDLDGSFLSCKACYAGEVGCPSVVQLDESTPNIIGVQFEATERREFDRIYVGFTANTEDFFLSRFGTNAGLTSRTKKTRMLPVKSVDPEKTYEIEFLNTSHSLFVFESNRAHIIDLK